MTKYIDIHALQTLPPSNVNRDDTGAPKTATFGGVPRQRVSSQSWKKAIRDTFKTRIDEDKLGVRTRRVVERVADAILREDGSWSREQAQKAAVALLENAKIKAAVPNGKDAENDVPLTGYLMFLSNRQIEKLADAILADPEVKYTKKEITAMLDTEHSFDIAMFGRMVAEAPDYNVDASVQVAHALGIGPSEPEFDYFTAVDDVVQDADESGAGMLGTVQMMSSTLYRYATVNVDALTENLGARDAAAEASVTFIDAFISSLPSGKINTFANQTLPYAVVVSVRDDRPVSYVNAYETPVRAGGDQSIRILAAQELVREAKAIESVYDSAPTESWVMAFPEVAQILEPIGTPVNKTELLECVRTAVLDTADEAK